jgi:glycosyltransferase involved in cell wall biosynthesis
MRIALCSTIVPFVFGGARNIVEWLQAMLERDGHQVERIYLPQLDSPQLLFKQLAAFRWIDLEAADRIICFRPQSHLIPHPNKVLWFIHHIRPFYDLWGTEYGLEDNAANRGVRSALMAADNNALREARSIFTNSKVVAKRLETFNGVDSEVLYPPVFNADRYHSREFNDEIVCICRLEHHKRQHLLIEALPFTKSPVRLRLCGAGSAMGYPDYLRRIIDERNLGDRITLDNRWISEEEKVDLLADCLAAAYIPLDEDSYGYPSVEASHANKAILTTSDSGGVLELIEDGFNGLVSEPTPQALADAMDRLYMDRALAKRMGRNSAVRLGDLNISWSHVLDRLLS